MKKIFLAVVTAAVALFGFTGCEELETKDVFVSIVANFGTTGSMDNLSNAMALKSDIENIFVSEMKKAAGAVEYPDLTTSVLFKAQTSEKVLKATILTAAEKADKAVKNKYGDGTTMNVPDYVDFLDIVVSYNWNSEPTEAVRCVYKEKK